MGIDEYGHNTVLPLDNGGHYTVVAVSVNKIIPKIVDV